MDEKTYQREMDPKQAFGKNFDFQMHFTIWQDADNTSIENAFTLLDNK